MKSLILAAVCGLATLFLGASTPIEQLVLFVLGLAMVVVGGDKFVDAAAAVATRLGMSPLWVGMTIVAFGTSVPELLVSLNAAFAGHPGISIGNVVGSNIANPLLILGVGSCLTTIRTSSQFIRKEGLFLVGLTILSGVLMIEGQLGRIAGSVLLITVIGFNIYLAKTSKVEASEEVEEDDGEEDPLWQTVVFLVGGLGLLLWGADRMVLGAVGIAHSLGVAESVISLTVVAFGTSVPELAATISAAKKGQGQMILGNVVGSNIFNIGLVLGVTGVVSPIPVENMAGDIGIMVFVSIALLGWMGRAKLNGAYGIIALGGYIFYLLPHILTIF